MRDIVLTLVIFGTLPFILWRPHIGVLVWTWIGFMNPHRLTWGFAYDMPFAMIVAVVTLVALLISREPKKIPWTRETIFLLIFLAWIAGHDDQCALPGTRPGCISTRSGRSCS